MPTARRPTALITGASSGIGAEFARQLADRGFDLVLVARDRAALEAVAASVPTASEILVADLADAGQTDAVARRIADPERPVDILVNNAGFGVPLDFAAGDVQRERDALHVMVEAPLVLSHAAYGAMRARGRGRVIDVASVAGFIPRSTYGASKAWVISFSRWANLRYRRDGVTTTAVCPGFVHTSFHARLGLPPGEEGVPGWMWLDARYVVRQGLRDAARGRSVSVPSLRYRVLVMIAQVLPERLLSLRAWRAGR